MPADAGRERHDSDLVMGVDLGPLEEGGGREDVVGERGRLGHEEVAHDQQLERRERLRRPLWEFGFVSAGFAPASSMARSGYGAPVRIPFSAVIVWHSRRTS